MRTALLLSLLLLTGVVRCVLEPDPDFDDEDIEVEDPSRRLEEADDFDDDDISLEDGPKYIVPREDDDEEFYLVDDDDEDTPSPHPEATPEVPPPPTVQEKQEPVVVDAYDEEEFEGFDGTEGPPSPPVGVHTPVEEPIIEEEPPSRSFPPAIGPLGWLLKRQRQVAKRAQVTASTEPQSYYWEMGGVALLVVYAVNFWIGRKKNEQIARTWLRMYRGLFMEQFSRVGIGDDEPGRPAPLLWKENASHFKFYATGRTHCESCLVTLELKKRHDLFSVLWGLVNPAEDVMTTEVAMHDDCVEPFVLAVVRCGPWEKQMHADKPDIDNYCTRYAPDRYGLNKLYSILTDCQEFLTSKNGTVLTDPIKHVLNTYHDLFLSLHFSDQLQTHDLAMQAAALQNQTPSPNSPPPRHWRKALQFQVRVPPIEQMDKLQKLMQMQLYCIDLVAKTKLPPAVKAKSSRARVEKEEQEYRKLQQQRDEAAQKKKLDKKAADDEKYANLTREQQKKREEKERKQSLKKQFPAKVKVLYG